MPLQTSATNLSICTAALLLTATGIAAPAKAYGALSISPTPMHYSDAKAATIPGTFKASSSLPQKTASNGKLTALISGTGTAPTNSLAASPGSGTILGTVSPITSIQSFNLTALGSTDWAAWGFNALDHSATGSTKVSNVAVYGGGSLNSFTSNVLGLTWTNGTPDSTATAETKGYYNAGGIGDGFTFTVPASTSTQDLTVFVGGYTSGGTLTATLSDNSAPAYNKSTLSSASISYYGCYNITFAAASPSQTLTIVWKQTTSTGNITIYAAALR